MLLLLRSHVQQHRQHRPPFASLYTTHNETPQEGANPLYRDATVQAVALHAHECVFVYSEAPKQQAGNIDYFYACRWVFICPSTQPEKNPSLQIAPINHRRRKEVKSGTAKAEMDMGWVHPWLGLGWVE